MWNDISDLRDFYDNPMGQVVQRILADQIQKLWPDLSRLSLLGLGFALPYLSSLRGKSVDIVAGMPFQQGVLHWPNMDLGRVFTYDEGSLPIPDLSFDRVLIVHGLECSENFRQMMREVWRVLEDSGRVIIIVPNRRGLWSRIDSSPFGNGLPYTSRQLDQLLRDLLFMPLRRTRAPFFPPSSSRAVLASWSTWENIGARIFHTFSGVLIVEAGKQLYAGTHLLAANQARKFSKPQSARET